MSNIKKAERRRRRRKRKEQEYAESISGLKIILDINLELILHNISCGVKRIPPNVQTNISRPTPTEMEILHVVSSLE